MIITYYLSVITYHTYQYEYQYQYGNTDTLLFFSSLGSEVKLRWLEIIVIIS